MPKLSSAEFLASLSEPERTKELARLTPEAKAALLYEWKFWARPNQLAPEGDWAVWLALAGRGFGKTEAGAQWVRERVAEGARSIALIAETQKDLEEVMVARLISIYPEHERPKVRYKPVRILWPNGAQALGYNGTEPDQLRGPEFDTAWVDELAKYRYARETWDMLQFTMRSGTDPRIFVTTTPRPIPVVKEIAAAKDTRITRGSTFDNASNLPAAFLERLREKYEGTRLGRQELHAEILDDVPGALWNRAVLDEHRIKPEQLPEMQRIVVACDPSGADGKSDKADDIGIVAAGLGIDGRYYVLADETCNLSPEGWGKRTVQTYHNHVADRVVGEANFGGDMVRFVIKAADPSVPYKAVKASRGKTVRAEPISALYEQGKVSHVGGFAALEDEMVNFTPSGYIGDGSPNRADALVWAITELSAKTRKEPGVRRL